jgi:hypothetical protein
MLGGAVSCRSWIGHAKAAEIAKPIVKSVMGW